MKKLLIVYIYLMANLGCSEVENFKSVSVPKNKVTKDHSEKQNTEVNTTETKVEVPSNEGNELEVTDRETPNSDMKHRTNKSILIVINNLTTDDSDYIDIPADLNADVALVDDTMPTMNSILKSLTKPNDLNYEKNSNSSILLSSEDIDSGAVSVESDYENDEIVTLNKRTLSGMLIINRRDNDNLTLEKDKATGKITIWFNSTIIVVDLNDNGNEELISDEKRLVSQETVGGIADSKNLVILEKI